MLIVLLLAAWLAVVLFGVTMCRLAALSDDSHGLAIAEAVARYRLLERHRRSSESRSRSPLREARHDGYRATG